MPKNPDHVDDQSLRHSVRTPDSEQSTEPPDDLSPEVVQDYEHGDLTVCDVAQEERSRFPLFYALHFTPLPIGWGTEVAGAGDSAMETLRQAYMRLGQRGPLRLLVLEAMPSVAAIATLLGTDLASLAAGEIAISPTAPEPFTVQDVADRLKALADALEEIQAGGHEMTNGAELGEIIGPVDLGLWLVMHIYLSEGSESLSADDIPVTEALTIARRAAVQAQMDAFPFDGAIH